MPQIVIFQRAEESKFNFILEVHLWPFSGKRWVECRNKGQISIPDSIDTETQVNIVTIHVTRYEFVFTDVFECRL